MERFLKMSMKLFLQLVSTFKKLDFYKLLKTFLWIMNCLNMLEFLISLIKFLVEKLHYVTFKPHEFLQLQEEFILLQSVKLQDFTESALDEATIRVDIDGNSKTYRIDILWYYLYMMKIPGTNKSKFENLFKLAKVVLSVVHSNAEEESLLSRVRKNFDGTLSSIISFQVNRPQAQRCYKYEPSPKIIEKGKKVT